MSFLWNSLKKGEKLIENTGSKVVGTVGNVGAKVIKTAENTVSATGQAVNKALEPERKFLGLEGGKKKAAAKKPAAKKPAKKPAGKKPAKK
jgi:hypothetical protein